MSSFHQYMSPSLIACQTRGVLLTRVPEPHEQWNLFNNKRNKVFSLYLLGKYSAFENLHYLVILKKKKKKVLNPCTSWWLLVVIWPNEKETIIVLKRRSASQTLTFRPNKTFEHCAELLFPVTSVSAFLWPPAVSWHCNHWQRHTNPQSCSKLSPDAACVRLAKKINMCAKWKMNEGMNGDTKVESTDPGL